MLVLYALLRKVASVGLDEALLNAPTGAAAVKTVRHFVQGDGQVLRRDRSWFFVLDRGGLRRLHVTG